MTFHKFGTTTVHCLNPAMIKKELISAKITKNCKKYSVFLMLSFTAMIMLNNEALYEMIELEWYD